MIIDARSAEDETVLLVEGNEEDHSIVSLRAIASVAASTLNSLDAKGGAMEELVDTANEDDGILRG